MGKPRKHHIDQRGVWSEQATQDSLQINHLANNSSSLVYINNQGMALTASLASLVRYEYHEHSGTQTITSSSFAQIMVNEVNDSVDGRLSVWNPSTSVFQPEAIGSVYTIRFSAQVEPIGGNPTMHIDFILSGSDPEESLPGSFRHHQSNERVIRNTEPHIHVDTIYTVFTDADLFASGGIIMALSTGANLNMISASIMIKEG